MDAHSDLDLENFESRLSVSALCHIPLVVPEKFLWCGNTYCPAGGASVIGLTSQL